MNVTAAIVMPEQVEVAITFTMRVDKWRRLLEQMPRDGSYPGWEVTAKIRAAIAMIEERQLVPKDL